MNRSDTPCEPVRRIPVRGRDGAALSFLFRRPETGAERVPCVLFIHGGGWSSCSADYYLRHMETVARRGAAAASAEYRLKTDGLPLSACIADCADIVSYLRREADSLGILPDRICVAGESAGGHLALCLATPAIVPEPEARPDLVVNLNGVVDMTGVFRDRFFSEEELADTSDADRWLERYEVEEALSPLYRVSAGNAPVVHFQGLKDRVVRPEETLRYHKALSANGVESELVLLPDQDHAFILFDYNNPDETVEKILSAVCDTLRDRGYLKI